MEYSVVRLRITKKYKLKRMCRANGQSGRTDDEREIAFLKLGDISFPDGFLSGFGWVWFFN